MYVRHLIYCVLLFATSSNSFAAEKTIDQIRTTWQAKQEPRRTTSVKFITTGVIKTAEGTSTQENTGVIRFTPKCTMLEYDVSKRREIVVCNPDYVFRVAKISDRYNLLSTTVSTDSNYASILMDLGLSSMKLYSPMVYDYDSILEISDKLDVEKSVNGTIFLKFTNSINTILAPMPIIYSSGQIEIMESNPEIVIGFSADSIINKHKCKIKSRYSYTEIDGKFLLVSFERNENYYELKGGMTISSNTAFQHEDVSNVTDADFYLTNFGMPEPLGVTPPRRASYMIYLYIAIPVFAAIGLLAAYMRRRSSRAAALPPAGTAGS